MGPENLWRDDGAWAHRRSGAVGPSAPVIPTPTPGTRPSLRHCGQQRASGNDAEEEPTGPPAVREHPPSLSRSSRAPRARQGDRTPSGPRKTGLVDETPTLLSLDDDETRRRPGRRNDAPGRTYPGRVPVELRSAHIRVPGMPCRRARPELVDGARSGVDGQGGGAELDHTSIMHTYYHRVATSTNTCPACTTRYPVALPIEATNAFGTRSTALRLTSTLSQ